MEHSDRFVFAAGLVNVVALYDRETATHLHATASLARRIAAHMQLPVDLVQRIELGGLLHDIGKVGVRREVLGKRGSLTDSEWNEMRVHSGTGAAVLDALPTLADLAPIVRGHHERLDGGGYPDRLRGDEIPLEARVVAVADAFHALTTDRPYRRAVLPGTALATLAAAGGKQFDAEVVAAAYGIFGRFQAAHRLTA